MKIFGYEFGGKSSQPADTETKSVVLGTSESLGSFLLLSSVNRGTTAASALNLYNNSSAVSIPVNRIATAIAAMRLNLELPDGTIISDHPVLDLLRKPSPYYTKTLFMEMIAKNYLITGEFQVVAIGGITRPPVELQPISPDKITVPEGAGGLPVSIIVTGTSMGGVYPAIRNGNTVRYLRDSLTEVHMTRNFKTKNNSLIRGQSLLVSASSEVRQHILGGTHNTSILEQGGRVSLVFHFKQDMDGDDFETAKQRVRAQYGGASKAGTIGVTAGDGDLEIKDIGSSTKDMDFAVLQKMAKFAIANQYAFPLVLLDNDKSTFNNYETAKEALYDDSAIPFADVILTGLSDFLLPRYGDQTKGWKLVPDLNSIPALTLRRNKELKIRRDINIESINELRDGLPNREDVQNGDDILVPANLVPLGIAPEPLTEVTNPAINATVPEGE